MSIWNRATRFAAVISSFALALISCGSQGLVSDNVTLSSQSNSVAQLSSSSTKASSSTVFTNSSPIATSSVQNLSSIGQSLSSSLVGTSSTTAPASSPSSIVSSSSSSLPSSSAIASLNTQACVYTPSASPAPATGTLACAEKSYKAVVIGTQTWMAENLDFATTTGSWCKVDNSNTAVNTNTDYCDVFGRLYDWNAAMASCPSSWHVPTRADWTTLDTYVQKNYGFYVGNYLKGSILWQSTADPSVNVIDAYGFNGIPAGYYSAGIITADNKYTAWWTATETSLPTYAVTRYLNYAYTDLVENSAEKIKGLSVRCLKDSP